MEYQLTFLPIETLMPDVEGVDTLEYRWQLCLLSTNNIEKRVEHMKYSVMEMYKLLQQEFCSSSTLEWLK